LVASSTLIGIVFAALNQTTQYSLDTYDALVDLYCHHFVAVPLASNK